MAVTVKKVTLWRREIQDRPGALAQVLAPLADAGASLRVVMGYRHPEPAGRAAVELAPVSGRKVTAAAQGAGLSPAAIGALLVEGDDRPGLGRTLSTALAAIFGFGSDADADRAVGIIKKSAAARPASRRAPARRAARSRRR